MKFSSILIHEFFKRHHCCKYSIKRPGSEINKHSKCKTCNCYVSESREYTIEQLKEIMFEKSMLDEFIMYVIDRRLMDRK